MSRPKKTARPAHPLPSRTGRVVTKSAKSREAKSSAPDANTIGIGTMTRKTIEVPEDYFYMVKQRALDRRIKEKQLWSEILLEYFTNHPSN